MPSIDYISYSGSENDAVIFDEQKYSLQNKTDPTSLVLYWIYNQGVKYLCLTGKGQFYSILVLQWLFMID